MASHLGRFVAAMLRDDAVWKLQQENERLVRENEEIRRLHRRVAIVTKDGTKGKSKIVLSEGDMDNDGGDMDFGPGPEDKKWLVPVESDEPFTPTSIQSFMDAELLIGDYCKTSLKANRRGKQEFCIDFYDEEDQEVGFDFATAMKGVRIYGMIESLSKVDFLHLPREFDMFDVERVFAPILRNGANIVFHSVELTTSLETGWSIYDNEEEEEEEESN